MATTPLHPPSLEQFLQPLHIDVKKSHALARKLCTTFTTLAKESQEQFLPTPISDSVLRPQVDGEGRYLAIDIGGTNLRVGFVELLGSAQPPLESSNLIRNSEKQARGGRRSHVLRHLEKAWPIAEQLKNHQAEDLFAWIGKCISEVVQDGVKKWPGELSEEIPLGVTFSFPMIQHTLSDATLMAMGKGFAMTENLDLGKHLSEGYAGSRDSSLPRIKITAIANDAVATLVSFAYQLRSDHRRKAAMGLIVGTGTNATIPLALSKLHPSKRPRKVQVLESDEFNPDPKITVNTEWTIKGAAAPLRELNLVTTWDAKLDAEGQAPGFQPFEYMTAGRYLGELGRIIIVDYFTNHLSIHESSLPPKLRERHGLATTFLGKINPYSETDMPEQLNVELPPSGNTGNFDWTPETADMVFQIAKAIQVRGSGMMAAAILGLLACAGELDFTNNKSLPNGAAHHPLSGPTSLTEELLVGYTGGCISHFQDYLKDCQKFLDDIMGEEFGNGQELRVVLEPCHDGGILGAGILAGTVKNIVHDVR